MQMLRWFRSLPYFLEDEKPMGWNEFITTKARNSDAWDLMIRQVGDPLVVGT